MAFYRSFIYTTKPILCQSFIMLLTKNESFTVKQVIFNCKGRYFIGQAKGSKIKKIKSTTFQTGLQEHFKNLPLRPHSYSLLLKPFIFTMAFSGATFVATSIWQYENVYKKAKLFLRKNWFSNTFITYKQKRYSWRQELNKRWNSLTEGQKLIAPICLINLFVFLAWKVKRFQPTMVKYFCGSPYSEASCWPMILTVFSHYNFFHLAANMYILYTFASSGVSALGKEQFLGLYLTGGVMSSFTSYLFKIITNKHTLSLGASGAVMTIIAYSCVKYPDSKLSLIFLPWIVFSASTGIKFIIGLDLLGALRGWSYLDHAAHLGGSFSGIGWYYWGNSYIWQKREPLLKWWHELRSNK